MPAGPPRLHAPCSKHFAWSDLIECGETWEALGPEVDNRPLAEATFDGIAALARTVLDPLFEHFGAVELTYGFASPALTKHIHGRIAPSLDQHAGAEHNRRGLPVCARGGQSCDLRVPGVSAADVAHWIAEAVDYDRLYLYGVDRPLHVSWSSTPVRRVTAMLPGGKGLVPMDASRRSWGEITALLSRRR